MLTMRRAVVAVAVIVLAATLPLTAQAQSPVWAWGYNGSGDLGIGTTDGNPHSVLQQTSGITNVVLIDGGENHSMAVKSDGTLWVWGSDSDGQLGLGQSQVGTNKLTPVQVPGMSNVTGISGSFRFSVALKSDGTVWAWGNGQSGEVGPGGDVVPSPRQVAGISDVTAIAAGGSFSVALKSDGTVWTWGNNAYGQLGNGTHTSSNTPAQIPGLSGVIAVSAGSGHAMALKSEGTVWVWGMNDWGQLGNGTFGDGDTSTVPVQANVTDIVAIAAGYDHCVTLKNDGTVWAWGYNQEGQVGDGTFGPQHPSPSPATGLSTVIAIAAGDHHTLALLNDGTVSAWGVNNFGQLGNDTVSMSAVPMPIVGLSGVSAIAGGGFHSLALGSIVYIIPTSVHVVASTAQIGNLDKFTAFVKVQENGAPITGKPVQFAIDGNNIGNPVNTDSTGKATLLYVLPDTYVPGPHTLSASYAGDATHASSTGSNTLTVVKGPTKTVVGSTISGPPGGKATVSAKLTNGHGSGIAGAAIDFTVEGNAAGSGTTDANGLAKVVYSIPADFALGGHPVTASFAGNASYLASSGNGTLNVVAPKLVSLAISPTAVVGGSNSTGTIILDGIEPADTAVTLTSSNPAVHVPATATVPAGSKTGTFTITTDPVAAKTTASITAKLDSITKSANITVNPPAFSSFTLTPNPVKGGNDVTGKVTMAGPVAADTTVNLTNANAKAHLPAASVTIPAGSASVSFTITTDVTAATASGAVKATVGTVTKSVTLKVNP